MEPKNTEPKTYGKFWDANQNTWVECATAEEAAKRRELGYRFYDEGPHLDAAKRSDAKAKGTLPPALPHVEPAKK